MKKIPIRIISTYASDTLRVQFFPTDICNFNCSYCFPGSGNVDKYRYPKNVNLVVNNFRKLFDAYKLLGKTNFHLMIAGGGEPTMWPGLEQFCKEIKETHVVKITIVTNASRTLRWWEENCRYFDDAVLSCHAEFVDIDHFISVGDLLFKEGLSVIGLMLMDAKNWDKCISYVDRMKTSKYPWYIQTKEIVNAIGHDLNSYTPEQLSYVNDSLKRIPDSDWLLKRFNDIKMYDSVALFDDGTASVMRPHEIITNSWNYFNGWNCNVSTEAIGIYASGEIYGGSCNIDIFKNKKVNIFSENFEIDVIPESVICNIQECNCQPDTHISKSRPK
jgi:organic radical activating enzyme